MCYPPRVGYLALQILGNTIFTMFVKTARQRKMDYLLVGGTNYLVAALVALALYLRAPTPISPEAAVLAAINGAQYQIVFVLMYLLLSMTGVAVMTSFLRLSIFVPTLASIFVWREWPTAIQAVGLTLTAVALPVLGAAAQQGAPSGWRSWRPTALIASTMLITGLGLVAAKAFTELHVEAQRPAYLAIAFAVATLFSALTWPLRGRLHADGAAGGAWPAIGAGALAGLCNVGQLAALLRGLVTVPGIIAFPVTAAGSLLLVTIAGRLLWRESLAGRAGAGIALTLAAVVLVNA